MADSPSRTRKSIPLVALVCFCFALVFFFVFFKEGSFQPEKNIIFVNDFFLFFGVFSMFLGCFWYFFGRPLRSFVLRNGFHRARTGPEHSRV